MMNRRKFAVTSLAAWTLAPSALRAQGDLSLKNEVQAAIGKGVAYLKSKQTESGSIGDPAYPALTALAATAIMGNPAADADKAPAEAVKAYDFLLSQQKPDGAIFDKALPNYNTALCLSALTMMPGDRYREAAIKARRPLISYQTPESSDDASLVGGIGYGNKPSADMSNTHFALEALHLSKKLLADDPDRAKQEPQLNYDAAIKFISRCQNLSATNAQSWVSDDPKNKGGFVYKPGDSKAGTEDLPDGKKAVRSYASIGYVGLLSFIYADVKADDQRVTAVKEWLAKNYSVTENPGMGQEGLFYYYHSMAKALGLSRTEQVELPDGKKANWRLDLARQLFNLQNPDGSFSNPNGRWMEKDPDLSTAYATLTLEHIIRGL